MHLLRKLGPRINKLVLLLTCYSCNICLDWYNVLATDVCYIKQGALFGCLVTFYPGKARLPYALFGLVVSIPLPRKIVKVKKKLQLKLRAEHACGPET